MEFFLDALKSEFGMEDKERYGTAKMFEDAESKTLLNEDVCQTHTKFAEYWESIN